MILVLQHERLQQFIKLPSSHPGVAPSDAKYLLKHKLVLKASLLQLPAVLVIGFLVIPNNRHSRPETVGFTFF